MKSLNLTKLNRETKVGWGIYISIAFLIAVWALSQIFTLSLSSAATLLILCGLTVFADFFPARIPYTKAYFSLGKVFVLLTAIFVGVPEAALLAGLDAFLVHSYFKNFLHRRFAEMSQAMVATAIAGTIFYFFLFYWNSISERPVGAQNIVFEQIALTATLFSSVFFIIDTLLGTVFRFLEKRQSIGESWSEEYFWLLPNYFFAVVLACPIQFLMSRFGWLGALATLPLLAVVYFFVWSFFRAMLKKSDESSQNERLHFATIETLASAIDARDQMSEGHIRRVQFYAKQMAKLLKLSYNELRALETAALLHGVGKLGVPDQILNKPQPLNQAEAEKVKTHATIGAAILEQINFPFPVTQTILHYRERWDGNGYPDGLRGEEIPLTSRVLSIADTYDTLRENRPYREAKSRDEARKLIHASAGSEFDPKLVDLFLRNLNQFEAEMDALGILYDDKKTNSLSFRLNNLNSSDGVSSPQTHLEQIKKANREIFLLYELAREFSSSLDLRNILKLFADKVQELVSCDTCIVYLFDEKKGWAVPAVVNGRNTAFLSERRIRLGEGVTGLVLKTKEAIGSVSPIEDFTKEYYDIAMEYTAMAALPLVSGSRVIGALSVYSTKFISYRDEDMRVLEAISRIATDALSRAIDHAESENRALTDPMTGLPNARCLQMQFEKEAARAQRTKRGFQVLMFDLDDFKKVNDTFGHKVGDLLLREISKVMRQQLREYDFLARYAGDEFVAILPEITDERALELCNRMEKTVLDFRLPVGENFARVGISIGSAAYPIHGETLDQVLIAADRMMYNVKATHKQVRQRAEEEARRIREEKARPVPLPPLKALDIIETEGGGNIILDRTNDIILEENIILEIDEKHIISNAVN